MPLELIGPHPFATDAQGAQLVRIGTLFPEYGTLYTQPPGVHAVQRSGFLDWLNGQHAKKGLPPLSVAEEEKVCANSVDLIFEPDCVLIRPDPDRMDLVFAADEQLQSLMSKRRIKFLSVADARVREGVKRRGECWRLSSIPKTQEARERLVFNSKVAIGGLPLYFYNRLTGTRWLTCQQFEELGRLAEPELARHLQELAQNSALRNRLGRPEVAFFGADPQGFGMQDLAGVAYEQLPAEKLRAQFAALLERFRAAVPEAVQRDDGHDRTWSERMLCALFVEGNESTTDQVLSGLSPEFFLRIEWLPGGRFEEGEFLFDSLFDEAAAHPEEAELQRLCDPRVKGIVFNLIRDYGDLEYVNVGCLPESLSLGRPQQNGRRGVYISEFKAKSEQEPIRRFMRLQKWDVWERLDQGKELLQAIKESDDYTDYWLDRRLGCRQLGMNLTRRVVMRRLSERYQGRHARYRGEIVRTTYFEREYLPGLATDKVLLEKYARPDYGLKLARLLGEAAASNIIVGRTLEGGGRAVFDDGDEMVREGPDGLPREILVSDHTGAFADYQFPLANAAAHYASPVNSREKKLADAKAFAESYLAAFRERFLHIQGDYRKRRRAFDTLFKHCNYDPAGSFAYRWELALRRLDQTDVEALVQAIRKNISALNPGAEPAVLSGSNKASG
jgi:hypothetical protein